jgi:hypothetical protein
MWNSIDLELYHYKLEMDINECIFNSDFTVLWNFFGCNFVPQVVCIEVLQNGL